MHTALIGVDCILCIECSVRILSADGHSFPWNLCRTRLVQATGELSTRQLVFGKQVTAYLELTATRQAAAGGDDTLQTTRNTVLQMFLPGSCIDASIWHKQATAGQP